MQSISRTPCLVILAVALLMAGPALRSTFAEDESKTDKALADAGALRDEAAAAYNEKKYAEAAASYRKAAAIYDGLGSEAPEADHAITLRALVWNEYLAGEFDKMVPTFERLFEVVETLDKLHHELGSAQGAFWHAGTKQESLQAVEALMAPVEAIFKKADMPRRAAQTRHDRGSLALRQKDQEQAIEHFEVAIAMREACGDEIGQCWSLNNLANLYLEHRKEIRPALPHLQAAFNLTQRSYVAPAQKAIGVNIGMALDLFESDEKARGSKWAREWARAMAESAADSRSAEAVSPGLFYRRALAWSAEAGKKPVQTFAYEFGRSKLAALHPLVEADIRLRTAHALIDLRLTKDATKMLDLPIDDDSKGPAEAHLRARLDVARARIAAVRKQRGTLRKTGDAALHAVATIGDKQLIRDSHAALAKAAVGLVPWPEDEEAQEKHPFADWVASSEEWRAKPVDGGPGGSASSGGDRGRFKDLKLDDDLFLIQVTDGNVVVKDVAAKFEKSFGVSWTPQPVALNGLTLRIFGGYLVVKSLAYGGASAVAGGASETTLDALGDYLPIPSKGYLVVQKNGAVRYR